MRREKGPQRRASEIIERTLGAAETERVSEEVRSASEAAWRAGRASGDGEDTTKRSSEQYVSTSKDSQGLSHFFDWNSDIVTFMVCQSLTVFPLLLSSISKSTFCHYIVIVVLSKRTFCHYIVIGVRNCY